MKRAFIIFTAILSLSFASCTEEEPKQPKQKPDHVLEKEKFVEVLTDVQLLEATMKKRYIRQDDPKVMYAAYYSQIFENHQISQETFVESFKYWSDQSEEMKVIYDKVIENLTKLDEPVSKDTTAREADSIQ